MTRRLKQLRTFLACAVALVCSGCHYVFDVSEAQTGEDTAMPALMQIDVANVIEEEVRDWKTFTGTLDGTEYVDIIALVSGHIKKRYFHDGAYVEAGSPLFKIDDRVFQAELNRLSSELESVKASVRLASKELDRARSLSEKKHISAGEYDVKLANYQIAESQVRSVEASIASTQLTIDFTLVKAPISGYVSNTAYSVGAYISSGATVLTSIVSTEKMHVYFEVDENAYFEFVRSGAAARTAAQTDASAYSNTSTEAVGVISEYTGAVLIEDQTDSATRVSGRIDFVDNKINQRTGTIKFRAVIDNPDRYYQHGQFVRVKLFDNRSYPMLMVKDTAINTDLSNRFVYVVNEDNSIAYRPVQISRKIGDLRYIEAGIELGETIVVNGSQHVYPGAVIKPNPTLMIDPDRYDHIFDEQNEMARLIARLCVEAC